MNPASNLERRGGVEHVGVTLDDLIIEHFDAPIERGRWGAPKVSAAMRGRRRVPHHKSLLGIALLGGIAVGLAGAGFLGFKRLFA